MAKSNKQKVFTLVVEVGRKSGDGLPKGSSGAGLLCYASGVDEAEAVRETVAVIKASGLAPLDVVSYGLADEERDLSTEQRKLIQKALDENAVVVIETTAIYPDQK